MAAKKLLSFSISLNTGAFAAQVQSVRRTVEELTRSIAEQTGTMRGDLNAALGTVQDFTRALTGRPAADAAQAVSAATVLRAAGVKTQVYFEERKFKQKMTYAGKSGIPFALILGEDEAAQGVVAVKNMATGEQLSLTPEAAAAHINAALEGRRRGRVIVG